METAQIILAGSAGIIIGYFVWLLHGVLTASGNKDINDDIRYQNTVLDNTEWEEPDNHGYSYPTRNKDKSSDFDHE